MLHFYKIAVTILLIFSFVFVSAQHEIITLKGDVFKSIEYKILDENDYKELMYLNKKGKEKYLDYESIFSIDNKVLYNPQDEYDFDVNAMDQIIKGRIQGRESKYKTLPLYFFDLKITTSSNFWVPFLTSFALTSASGFVDMTNQGQMFITPLIPLGATIGIGLYGWKSKVKHDNQNEYFVSGYKEQRAFKMIKASLLGGAAGFVAAGTAYSIRHQ
jgi:hypothetical protein